MREDEISCGYILEHTDVYTFMGIDFCKFADSYYSRVGHQAFERVTDIMVEMFIDNLRIKHHKAPCVIHITTDRWN